MICLAVTHAVGKVVQLSKYWQNYLVNILPVASSILSVAKSLKIIPINASLIHTFKLSTNQVIALLSRSHIILSWSNDHKPRHCFVEALTIGMPIPGATEPAIFISNGISTVVETSWNSVFFGGLTIEIAQTTSWKEIRQTVHLGLLCWVAHEAVL